MSIGNERVLDGVLEEKIKTLKIESQGNFFIGTIWDFTAKKLFRRGIRAEIVSALDAFGVLIFKSMPLTHVEQLAFAQYLGTKLHRKTGVAAISENRYGDEALTDVSNIASKGRLLSANDRRRLYGLSNRLWHTDASFQNPPGRYSMLSAKVVPRQGGETDFADTRGAYYLLPQKIKRQISDLRVHHSIAYSRQTLGFEFTSEESKLLKGAEQPLVKTNANTQLKSLYIASHCSSIPGMSTPDARILIQDLIEHSTQSVLVHRHRWEKDDFVIWDNFATMHRGRIYDDLKDPRELVRVTTLEI